MISGIGELHDDATKLKMREYLGGACHGLEWRH
jgi:hypothetical protein